MTGLDPLFYPEVASCIWALQFSLINNQQIFSLVAMTVGKSLEYSDCQNVKQPWGKGWENRKDLYYKHVTVHPLIFLAGLML